MNSTMDPMQALAAALAPIMDQQKARQYGLDSYAMGFKHDIGGTPSPITVGYSHGPGGRFTFPGVDPVMFNAAMGARSILDQIPAIPSLYTNPTYMTVTGVTDETGDEKVEVCDDAPVAGLMKGCLVTSVFGRYEIQTAELELNRLGQRNDRSDPLDLQLVGSPFAAQSVFSSGNMNPNAPGDVLVNEVSRKFWERNVAFHRKLARQLWAGTPANNSAGGGYKELTGFSTLVNTGHVDAETNVACPAMDSYVRSFGYGSVSGSGASIVAAITDMYYQVVRRADMMGLSPVRWVFAMRSQLFYEVSAVWPCSYLTARCYPDNGAQEIIDSQDAIRFRDDMRTGRYLLIDGVRVDVLLDDGIPESSNTTNANVASGCFGTDIYLIPMSVVGGRAVTYLEYFEYNNPSIDMALANMILAQVEGPFLTWPKQTNQCVQWQSKVEPRLVLRTPWLAARLQNVVYCPIQHERQAFPDDPYFVNGGGTSRSGPSLYSLWQS